MSYSIYLFLDSILMQVGR